MATVAARGSGYAWSDADAIAADRFGGLAVLSRSAGVVFLFDPELRYAGRLDPPAGRGSLLGGARDLAVDPDGAVRVLVRPSGGVLEVWR